MAENMPQLKKPIKPNKAQYNPIKPQKNAVGWVLKNPFFSKPWPVVTRSNRRLSRTTQNTRCWSRPASVRSRPRRRESPYQTEELRRLNTGNNGLKGDQRWHSRQCARGVADSEGREAAHQKENSVTSARKQDTTPRAFCTPKRTWPLKSLTQVQSDT